MRPPLELPELGYAVRFDPRSQCAQGIKGFAGLRVLPDFVTESEAASLLDTIEETPFVPAQSGKRKQHFGPKMNFRKQRMNASGFEGIPAYARALEVRLRKRTNDAALEEALGRYRTTDVFVLRYNEDDQSNLDFHSDDVFAYGEVILNLSLESNSVLSFLERETGACVRAAIPARSLAVLFGAARYDWEHAILADDVSGRRTSITLRTLSDELRGMPEGQRVMALALGT